MPEKNMNNNHKTQGGVSRVTTSIIILACGAIIAGSYIGYTQVKKYQFQQAEKEKASQALIAEQQKALQETQQQIRELREETQKSSLAAGEAERVVHEAQRKLEERDKQNTEADTSSIVAQWQGSIGLIHCFGGKFGAGQTSGSGVAFQFSDVPNPVVITNKHVLTDEWGYSMNNCLVSFYGNPKLYANNSNIVLASFEDFGTIELSDYDNYVKEISYFSSVRYCINSPSLGDKILILGYPVTASVGTLLTFHNSFNDYQTE